MRSLLGVHLKFLIVLCGLLALCPVRVAHADEAADRAKGEADRHFQLGVKLYDEGKYGEALVEFQRAYEIFPHPSVLYNMAVAYRELSEYDLAIEHFERFLAEAPGKVKQERLDRAQKELDELRARVGFIEVVVSPDGSTVVVDGKEVGETPLPRPIVRGAGDHVIEIRGENGRVETRSVRLAAGDRARIEVDVSAMSRPPGGGDGGGGDTVILRPVTPRDVGGRFGVAAAVGTNVATIGDTGAPVVGASVRFGRRVTAGVDVVLVAWAVIPQVRIRLAGDKLAVHAIVAAPISLTDGDTSEVVPAGAAGLGVRLWAAPRIAVRAEALVAVAGSGYGVTVPVFAGVELWF